MLPNTVTYINAFQIGQTAAKIGQNSRTVNRVGCPSVAAVHERGDERVVSIPKGVCSAHTQAALTGARPTPSARADANGSKVRRDPPKRCTRLLNVAALAVHRRRGRVRAI